MADLLMVLASADFWQRFALLSAVPYVGMYGVAIVFESRFPGLGPGRTPVWTGQSRAFLPGEAGLALMVAVMWEYRSRAQVPSWTHTARFMLISEVVMVLVFVLVRKYLYTPRDYTPEAWRSPSKRYHDVVMYLLFGWLVLVVCAPVLLFGDWSVGTMAKLLGLAGLVVWIAGNVWDFTHDETPNDLQHPTKYVPIWVH